MARLIRKVKSGLPYILTEAENEHKQTVYQNDKWQVELETGETRTL